MADDAAEHDNAQPKDMRVGDLRAAMQDLDDAMIIHVQFPAGGGPARGALRAATVSRGGTALWLTVED